jgi:hypothetical protein
MKRRIERSDILKPEAYAASRLDRRRAITELKRQRRMEVGPYATFHFESYETMWQQVHEMLHIEKGGDAQIADELAAYNPLIPQGSELVATVMFEIEDPQRRAAILARLGGVEHTAFIEVEGVRVTGKAAEDQDRTSEEGKASSVQFIHFPFEKAQVAAFKTLNARVIVGFTHPQYSHMAVMPEAVRAALAGDFE